MPMRRRRLLVLGGVLAVSSLTGCFSGGGISLSLERVEPVDHFSTPADSMEGWRSEAADTVVAGEEYVSYGRRPFPDTEYIENDGAYYRTEAKETGGESLRRKVLYADRADTSNVTDAVGTDAYEGADRELVVEAYRLYLSDTDIGRDSRRGITAIRVPENETALLPEPEHPYITVRGNETFRLRVEEHEIGETEYTTTATKVAEDEAGFVEHLNSEQIVEVKRSELPDEQREILDTAIEEGSYREQRGGEEAMGELLDSIYLENRSQRVLKYDGEYYEWYTAGP